MRIATRRKPREPSAFAPAVGVKSAPAATGTTSSAPPRPLTPSAPSSPPSHAAVKRALVHFLSAGLSAGLVRASLQPLDTCKTRLQASSASASTSLRTTLLANRGLRGLYKGVVPGVVGIVPAAAVYMLVFQTLKTRLAKRFPRRGRNAAIALSAAVGDVAASLVRVPCEVLKQRLQVGVYNDLGAALRTLAAARQLPKLYAGLSAQLARDVPYAAVEFVFYENLKNGVSGDGDGTRLSRAKSFLVGGASGAAAAIASNPLDVVKTRLMTQMKLQGAVRYRGVGHALVTVAKEEGLSAFAKGIAPRIAAKTLQSALFFAAYETIKRSIAGVVGVEMKAKTE